MDLKSLGWKFLSKETFGDGKQKEIKIHNIFILFLLFFFGLNSIWSMCLYVKILIAVRKSKWIRGENASWEIVSANICERDNPGRFVYILIWNILMIKLIRHGISLVYWNVLVFFYRQGHLVHDKVNNKINDNNNQ